MSENLIEKYQSLKLKLNKAIEWINYLNKKQKNLENRIEFLENQNSAISNYNEEIKISQQKNVIIPTESEDILLNSNKEDVGGFENEENNFNDYKKEEINVDKIEKTISLEEKIGSNWFAWLGILALIFGIGFFIKHSFTMNWINHLTRIFLGLLVGAGLVFGGEKISFRKKYKNWGETLVGGGLAVIYFSIFAAYHFESYRFEIGIGQITDILLLIVVVVCSVLISLKKDSRIIASEAFFLGYMTSLLAGNFDFLSLIYGLLLTLGLVSIVIYKKWQVIGLGGMIASYFLFLPWASQNNSFLMASVILITYFLSFIVQFSVDSENEKNESYNIFGFCLNTLFFFGFFYSQFKEYVESNFVFTKRISDSSLISNSQLNQILALTPLFLAVFFLILYSTFKTYYSKKFLDLLNYLSLFFITISISIYFNSGVVTIFWLLEFILLLSGFIKTKSNLFKNSALVLGFISGLKLITVDLTELNSWEGSNFEDPRRFVILIFGALIFYLASYLLVKHKELLVAGEEIFSKILSIAGLALTLLLIFTEITPINSKLTSLSLILVFIVLLMAFYAKKSDDYFFESNFIFILLILNLIVNLDIGTFNPSYLYFTLITILIGISSYVLGFFVKNKLFNSRFETRSLVNFYNYSGLILFFSLILNQFSGAMISFFWGLLALIILAFGFSLKDKDLRLQSFFVLALVIFKVFIIDVAELEIVYRIFSYIGLGSILLLVSFIYNKNKDKLKDLF